MTPIAFRPYSARVVIATALAGVLVALCLLGRPAPAEAQVTAMLPDMLKNLSYPSDVAGGTGRIQLRDGEYQRVDHIGPPLNLDFTTTVSFVTSATREDFAAVVLAESGGGSGLFYRLHLVRARNGVATAGPGIALGDRVRIEKIGISEDGCLVIELVVAGPNDPLCCPSKREEREYLPVDNGFRLLTVNGQAVPASNAAAAPVPPRTGSLGAADEARSSLPMLALGLLAAVLVAGTRRGTRPAR